MTENIGDAVGDDFDSIDELIDEAVEKQHEQALDVYLDELQKGIDTIETSLISQRPDQNPAAIYLSRLGVGSRRTMRQSLEVVASMMDSTPQQMPWDKLRYQHTQAIRAKLLERYSISTANKILAAVRGVLKEAYRLGLVCAEDYHRATDVESFRLTTNLKGRALSKAEIRALFNSCAQDLDGNRRIIGSRDAALLAVLYSSGLRRSEATKLKLDDYNNEDSSLRVISGKGNKDRYTYLSASAQHALLFWLDIRGSVPGFLFLRLDKIGRLSSPTSPLSDQAVMTILASRAKRAGVIQFSPHDLRRTFISDLLDSGVDISTVQHLAGHSDIKTTARYDRRGEASKKRAVQSLLIPFDKL